MKNIFLKKYGKSGFVLCFALGCFCFKTQAQTAIYVNQVAYDGKAPKMAVIRLDEPFAGDVSFDIKEAKSLQTVFTEKLISKGTLDDWAPGKTFYTATFSLFDKPGKYVLSVAINDSNYTSDEFEIAENALAELTIPAIIHYYHKQRANTPQELAADKNILLYGSNQTVDMHGGWCDASGDVSKYFSHLAYANFMSPQQTPLVTWSMINATEAIPKLLTEYGVKDSIINEALWGADYMTRALSKEDYFYMIVFSYFDKDPKARRVVGLRANSVTTNEYQCAFREGGGMAIAALARIARWKRKR